jgi:hypothetical protein
LFKRLATLRSDAPLFSDVASLKWQGATRDFAAIASKLGDPRILERAEKALHLTQAPEASTAMAFTLKGKSTKTAKPRRKGA